MKKRPATRHDNQVVFRLDLDDLDELETRAARLGVGKNILAREYVLEMLSVSNTHAQQMRALQAFDNNLNTLRIDLALSVEALLLATGDCSKEEAHKWVVTQFKIG